MLKEKFIQLKPQSDESFGKVYPRLQSALPNFPKNVIEQWVFRHFDSFIDKNWWIGLEGLSFNLESWSNEDIFNKVNSLKMDMVDHWGDRFCNRLMNKRLIGWLDDFYMNKKKWPHPIIILKNKKGIADPDGKQLSQPYHLLEGHMRLAYFRAFIKKKISPKYGCQDIWIVEFDPDSVCRSW
ncbi:MAG: hypothetical protein GY729_03405 [Desulfobacteraceae bacterium]|nr:hypothetical protein [Desulfobacteraceae bacterium]